MTNGPFIRAEDSEALESFATFLAIGYSSKFESPDCMRKIIERLPPKLQASWRDSADRILNSEGRDIGIDDISLFVEQKARALSNPVFGKLPFLEKERKNSRNRGQKYKTEKRSDKQISSLPLLTRSLPVHPVVIRPIQPTLPRGSAPFAMQIISWQNVPVSLKCSQLTSVTSL